MGKCARLSTRKSASPRTRQCARTHPHPHPRTTALGTTVHLKHLLLVEETPTVPPSPQYREATPTEPLLHLSALNRRRESAKTSPGKSARKYQSRLPTKCAPTFRSR